MQNDDKKLNRDKPDQQSPQRASGRDEMSTPEMEPLAPTGQQGEPMSQSRDTQAKWDTQDDAHTLGDQPPQRTIGNQPGGGGSGRPSQK
jgi:hypothetical protein